MTEASLLKADKKSAHGFDPKPLFGLRIERARLWLYITLILAEIGIIWSAILVVDALYLGVAFHPGATRLASMLVPPYLTLALYTGVYSIAAISDFKRASTRIFTSMLTAVGLFLFLLFTLKATAEVSRFTAIVGTIVGTAGIVLLRRAVIAFVHRRFGPRAINFLVIDDGGPDVSGLHALYLDARAFDIQPDLADPHMLNLIGQYFRNADRVLVSTPPERRRAWAGVLRAAGVRGEIASDATADIAPIGLDRYDNFTSLIVATGPLGLRQQAVKRIFDLAIAVPLFILLLPLQLLIALAIKIEDGGKALFVQKRVGYANRFFTIYKFRTMHEEAADLTGAISAASDDTRMTWAGRLLRQTSMDELPQLMNVIAGHMSLVGPRPHAIGSRAGEKLFWEIDDAYWDRHALKPGLTGLAQVRGWRGATRDEADLSQRLSSDLEYASGWTVLRDIAILVRTLKVVVHRNAF